MIVISFFFFLRNYPQGESMVFPYLFRENGNVRGKSDTALVGES